jgi:hypothetical protein
LGTSILEALASSLIKQAGACKNNIPKLELGTEQNWSLESSETPPNGRKTADKSQGFIKNGEINAGFRRMLAIKAYPYSKKWHTNPQGFLLYVQRSLMGMPSFVAMLIRKSRHGLIVDKQTAKLPSI